MSPTLPENEVPHVTIIRPVKGLEPKLYECIASTFRLDYPRQKLSIRLCVSDKNDSAYPLLAKIVEEFPGFDAQVLVEEEDPLLPANLGPNPKIRNISRAYREAKGDIIWVMDCNVWVPSGSAGRMVDKLAGFRPGGKRAKPYKFAHMLPLVTETERLSDLSAEAQPLLTSSGARTAPGGTPQNDSLLSRILRHGGGRLDEMFMATTHAKFYSAINTVGIAPCTVGKSNMFRKSQLDILTDPAKNPSFTAKNAPVGIDYFSKYICEDHLIGDTFWRAEFPGFDNHALVSGDLAIQPMARFSVQSYIGRRVRWLRARKWTVLAATLVEPGVESLLCCAHFAFALTTLPWVHETLGVPQTWAAMGQIWAAAVSLWMFGDWCTYSKIHAGHSIEVDEHTPRFARGTGNPGGAPKRSFLAWLPAWLGRELLALPIWTWAVLLGSTVTWRGQTFRVLMDMSVVEMDAPLAPATSGYSSGRETPNGDARARSKARRA